MKSYTDLKQSKKLAKILPIESADMFHFVHEVDTVGFGYKKDAEEFYSKTEFEYIPCWSLAALLKALDFPSLTQNKEDEWEVCVFDHDIHGYIEKTASNPVDVCVNMVIKLNEKGLL